MDKIGDKNPLHNRIYSNGPSTDDPLLHIGCEGDVKSPGYCLLGFSNYFTLNQTGQTNNIPQPPLSPPQPPPPPQPSPPPPPSLAQQSNMSGNQTTNNNEQSEQHYNKTTATNTNHKKKHQSTNRVPPSETLGPPEHSRAMRDYL